MAEVDTRVMKIWSDRWRLGALTQPELGYIALTSIVIGMLFLLFHLLGNTVSNVDSRSAFVWMVARWNDKVSFGADYSHGYLIPFVSLGIVWYKRQEFFDAPKKICLWGLGVIIMALFMHWVGAKMQQTRISLVSLIALLWGIPLYFMGWQVAKRLIFPCVFLIFCVPLNFLDAISFPLQKLATSASYSALKTIGIDVVKVGTQLISPVGLFELNVEAPCSGLRSLLALTALAAVYGYFNQKGIVKQWILFLSSILFAVLGNIGRILSIAVVSVCLGQKVGGGLWHDWAGYLSFGLISISLLLGFSNLLAKDFVGAIRAWIKR